MKRTLVLTIALALAAFASPFQANAQMTLGVGGGIVVGTLSGSDADDLYGTDASKGSRIGMNAGAYLAIPVADRFAIVPGAHFVQKGVEYTENGGDGFANIKTSYIEIPITVSVTLTGPDSGVGFNIFAGPSFAIEMSCKTEFGDASGSETQDCDADPEDEHQTFDIGLLGGAGVSFPIGESLSLMISGGYDLGLRNLDTSTPDPDKIKNSAFFGGVAVGIPVG